MPGHFPLAGKIIAITGGASGIGLALGKLALSSSAKVLIADLKLRPETEKLLREHRNARFVQCDVTRWKDLQGIVSSSESEFGDIPDVYAANAGVGEPAWSSFWHDTEKERYAELDINLSHPIKLTRIAIRELTKKQKKGVVVITSSIAGLNGHFSTALYSASKHGTIGLIRSMAKAEKEFGVKVVGICPGLVQTPLLEGIQDNLDGTQPPPVPLMEAGEIAQRMKELIEDEKYKGGMALGVYAPGEAEVVADGASSRLEELSPSDITAVHKIVAGNIS